VTGLVSGLTGGLTSAAGGGASPLAPVTGLVSGVTGGLTSAAGGSSSPLAPVTGLVSGVTGGLTGGNSAGTTASPLAPVTGIVAGLTGGNAPASTSGTTTGGKARQSAGTRHGPRRRTGQRPDRRAGWHQALTSAATESSESTKSTEAKASRPQMGGRESGIPTVRGTRRHSRKAVLIKGYYHAYTQACCRIADWHRRHS
jgi:hypothetical protein